MLVSLFKNSRINHSRITRAVTYKGRGMFGIIEIFCAWCRQKIALHVDERPAKFFKQGEVWWCRVGKNVGDEIYGKGEKFARPVLIIKKLTRTTFLALP